MGQRSDEGLVEPEGVNAASEEVAEETQQPVPEHDRGRSGGHPEAADQSQDTPAEGELLGPPSQDGDEPGQELSQGEG